MDVLQPFLLFLYFTLTEVLSKHIDHRNLFAQRACCKRRSHLVYIGQDISGSPVSIDVGKCRPHCARTSSKQSHEATPQEYSRHASMLEFLRSKKLGIRAYRPASPESSLGATPSCGLNEVCQPTGVRMERVLLFEGPREVEIIQECHCEIKLTQCIRVPALKTYYAETPYESVLDVGGCSQSKGSPDGFSCLPTQFDSALVQTPNKVELIQTVVTCDLKESCYRAPHMDYYYEIVHHADGVREEQLKEIDVGRCLGSCTAGNRCLLRSPAEPGVCHQWLDQQSSTCVPQNFESHRFLSQHEQIRTVHTITSCVCRNSVTVA